MAQSVWLKIIHHQKPTRSEELLRVRTSSGAKRAHICLFFFVFCFSSFFFFFFFSHLFDEQITEHEDKAPCLQRFTLTHTWVSMSEDQDWASVGCWWRGHSGEAMGGDQRAPGQRFSRNCITRSQLWFISFLWAHLEPKPCANVMGEGNTLGTRTWPSKSTGDRKNSS